MIIGSRGTLAALLVMTAGLGGCAKQLVMRPIEHGRVAEENVRIVAEDGAFTLTSGSAFTPPFQVDSYTLRGSDWHAGNLAGKAEDALEIGGEPVRVHVPGVSEPLYGVLVLSMGPERVSSPAWRSYEIRVPESYVRAALGGVSVVYELGPLGNGRDWFSWVLWLSNTPFG